MRCFALDQASSSRYRPRQDCPDNLNVTGSITFLLMRQDSSNCKKNGQFLESAFVHGHYYGTSSSFVEETLANGDDLLLEIDCQGASQIKRLFPEAVVIFIAPPSVEELRRRLHARAQDDEATIARRIEGAKKELQRAHEADYLVINDDFDQALLDLQRIVEASALRYHLRLSRFPLLAERLGLRSGS